ncbi:GNAT family N-acetyltransferase [Pseudoduganella sp. GCM10020061]|uniref:GNAT family N-acetyltransferase n=1 Tax=Pseudoduganella sp. GCM10020061 TaxID=3317345 RepID=UPI0036423641
MTKLFRNPLRHFLSSREEDGQRPRRAVLVKELGERDRHRVRKHFLALDEADRLLRFGNKLGDQQIIDYVDRLDFKRDTLYGVYNRTFRLDAVAHLAFAPKTAVPGHFDTEKEMIAEFGVSVLKHARGMGLGSALFERAAIHCRNNDVDTLYMHYLTRNKAIMHIAQKAGMQVERDFSESEAYLKILPPSPGSVLQEALQEQFATIDYTLKAQVRAATKLFEPPRKRPGRDSE